MACLVLGMAILLILTSWIGLSTLVCLALLGAVARPTPSVSERRAISHQAQSADYDSSELETGNAGTSHGVIALPSVCSVG